MEGAQPRAVGFGPLELRRLLRALPGLRQLTCRGDGGLLGIDCSAVKAALQAEFPALALQL